MARERFIDPAGKPFEIDTELLAGAGNARGRMNERQWWNGRGFLAPAERRPAPPTRMCAHGNRSAYCGSCSTDYCACPGSLPHNCNFGLGFAEEE